MADFIEEKIDCVYIKTLICTQKATLKNSFYIFNFDTTISFITVEFFIVKKIS